MVSSLVSKRSRDIGVRHLWWHIPAMPNPAVSLRVKVPLTLYERIGEYRHTARHDSKNQALVTLSLLPAWRP